MEMKMSEGEAFALREGYLNFQRDNSFSEPPGRASSEGEKTAYILGQQLASQGRPLPLQVQQYFMKPADLGKYAKGAGISLMECPYPDGDGALAFGEGGKDPQTAFVQGYYSAA